MILIAGALVAATMGDDAVKRMLRVYPTEDLRGDRSAAIEYELTIDPEGKMVKCTPLRAVGDERLAAKLCSTVEAARFRYTPAIAPDGTRAYGVIHTTSSFFLPDTRLGREIRDYRFDPVVQVEVQALPSGVDDPTSVNVVTFIDSDGKVAACEHAPDARVGLAEVACAQVQSQVWDRVADAAGSAVPYVRGFSVRFTTAYPSTSES